MAVENFSLTGCDLSALDDDTWRATIKIIGSVKNLDLSHCAIARLSDARFSELIAVIKSSRSIQFLDISYNELGKLKEDKLAVLRDAIKASSIIGATVSGLDELFYSRNVLTLNRAITQDGKGDTNAEFFNRPDIRALLDRYLEVQQVLQAHPGNTQQRRLSGYPLLTIFASIITTKPRMVVQGASYAHVVESLRDIQNKLDKLMGEHTSTPALEALSEQLKRLQTHAQHAANDSPRLGG